MSADPKLMDEMKIALFGVDKFLKQMLETESLSPQAQSKCHSLRNNLAKVLEKASTVGKPLPLSPSSSGLDIQAAAAPPPQLPQKPTIQLPPPLESLPVEDEPQEEYEAMDPIERPRIDTAISLYADMACLPQPHDPSGGDADDGIMEETYEAMDASPAHSGSGQVARQPPPPIDDELYLDMETAHQAPPAMGAKPGILPPKPGADQGRFPAVISGMGVADNADGFDSQDYVGVAGPGSDEMDDMYEAPAPVGGSLSSGGGSEGGGSKLRASTLPISPSQNSTEDEDPYAYQIPTLAQKMSVESLASSTSHKGFLEKLGGRSGNKWQRRYVALADGALYYYEGEKDKKPKNVVPIAGYRVEVDPEFSKGKWYAFKVTPLSADKAKSSAKSAAKGKGGKMYHFRANGNKDREEWVSALRLALVRANRRSTSFLDAAVEEQSGASGSGSVTSSSSAPGQKIMEEADDFYEDPMAAAPKTTVPTTSSPPPLEADGDDYLAPNEMPEVTKPKSPLAQPEAYLPPVELTKPRAASTFGIGKEVETTNLAGERENNPYGSRKDANPYASRQQMKLPQRPVSTENPYQSSKQAMPLPKAPADNVGYMSRKEMKLPPLPAQVAAPTAPKAPVPVVIDEMKAIYVQLPDAKFKFDQVFVAQWDYQPSADDELSFRRGDLVYIEDIIDSADWWVGRKKTDYDKDTFTGDRGLLVSAYVSPAYEKLI